GLPAVVQFAGSLARPQLDARATCGQNNGATAKWTNVSAARSASVRDARARRFAVQAGDGDRNAGAWSSFAFRSELIRDRQLPDSFPRGGEDRVRDRRRDRRYARLAYPAQRPVEVGTDQMHANVARCDVHARHLVIVEIAFVDAAVLERDLRQERVARAHHASTFDLRADTFRIDLRAAVERHVDLRNSDLTLFIHRDLHDCGNVRHEAVVRGDA